MWGYKRNHIQIIPKYRKEFRGHKAVLHIFEYGWKEVYSDSGACGDAQLEAINSNPTEEDWDSSKCYLYGVKTAWGKIESWGKFFNNIKEYKEHLKSRHMRLLMEYAYILEVPTVPGEVSGIYTNFSFDMKSTIRRLSRMVGKKNLKVVKHKGSMYEFLENLEGTK